MNLVRLKKCDFSFALKRRLLGVFSMMTKNNSIKRGNLRYNYYYKALKNTGFFFTIPNTCKNLTIYKFLVCNVTALNKKPLWNISHIDTAFVGRFISTKTIYIWFMLQLWINVKTKTSIKIGKTWLLSIFRHKHQISIGSLTLIFSP